MPDTGSEIVILERYDVPDEQLNGLFERCGWEPRYSWHRARESALCFATAWQGQRLVGMGRLARNNTRATIYDLLVDPELRRRGLASRLCRILEEKAARLGYDTVHADSEDIGAQKLYAVCGFTEIESCAACGHVRVHFFKKVGNKKGAVV